MDASLQENKNAIVEKIVQRIRDRVQRDRAGLCEQFARLYFKGAPPDALLERSLNDLYGSVIAHWNFARKRTPRQRLVRVYNPDVEIHGWHSTHTVIEIVHKDMPFLLDSTIMAVNRRNLRVHYIFHPVIRIERDDQGDITAVAPPRDSGENHEAIMHLEVDRQTAREVLASLEAELGDVLDDVSRCVADWQAMRNQLKTIITQLKDNPPPLDGEDTDEDIAFLQWLDRDHFTFLGYREYELDKQDGEDILRIVPDTGLGILRDHPQSGVSRSFSQLPAGARQFARRRTLLTITKTNAKSTVHRPVYMDYIGIKRFGDNNEIIGEWRFIGLYTSSAYIRRPEDIPLLRRKVSHVMNRSGYRPSGHSFKALLTILDTLPRDELFQASDDELYHIATAILHLQERQRVRVLLRHDPFQRFFSALVFLPRDRFNTENRVRIQNILRDAFNATAVDFTILLSESILARVHLIIHVEPGTVPSYNIAALEAQITDAIRSWTDELHSQLIHEHGEEIGNRLFERYKDAFPASYREDYPATLAATDIHKIESLSDDHPLAMSLYRPIEMVDNITRFKLIRSGDPIALSAILPILENMGVNVIDERPHEIRPRDGVSCWIHDIGLACHEADHLTSESVRHLFQEAFASIWHGMAENDGFNELTVSAKMSWREITVLRMCCKYIRQTDFPFSQNYMERALTRHPHIARLLVNLFKARFDPAATAQAETRSRKLSEAISRSLDEIPNLDEDRIYRRFFTVIKSILRTNYFQNDAQGRPKPYLAVKLDPSQIPDLPLPRPAFEIFVYSPQMEGIHLRGGTVARGGLRWSDRLEDFRTEIFGLMKTQMVKNAVIVPVGAKGGFVIKPLQSVTEREARAPDVTCCYQSFIRGLLDLTDNIVDGEIVPPPKVVRYDGDDPYLVVAADKGTATFSDTANAIAREYNFWLDDAFASGGANGYDHKKMGITAKGAWESVKRHFRELGVDIQTTDFTVVGIGSMNGDVFGNGMLLSPHIRLLAAFSHSHIFLDPNPDPRASFQERQRLFNLPRSTWKDYNPELISPGGGVFSRSAKVIHLSPEAQAALAIERSRLSPNELIRAILQAPVDLLWNGGIGTFVKASYEINDDVGDHSNDAIRIDAPQLRCKVIGEGGNLGLTDEARIEYARNGGRLNTDFIDNAAGVDCSDHEVNIKILLAEALKSGELTKIQRNELLATMTDEITRLVLVNNYQQALALSLAEQAAPELLDEHSRLIKYLQKTSGLERRTWHLPNDDQITQRKQNHQGLTRPELAVLLSYSKISLYDTLLASDLCDDPDLLEELHGYFPAPVRERFAARIRSHRLHREIIATAITNNLINRMGMSFPYRLQEHTGCPVEEVTRAYLITQKVFNLRARWREIERLDNQVASEHQLAMFSQTIKLANRATHWFLRNCVCPLKIAETAKRFLSGVNRLTPVLPDLLEEPDYEKFDRVRQHLVEQNVPETLAAHISVSRFLSVVLDIIEVSNVRRFDVMSVAKAYFALGARLDLHWLRNTINELPEDQHWNRLARTALRDDLFRLHRNLTDAALTMSPRPDDTPTTLETWIQANAATLERYCARMSELKSAGAADLAHMNVAINEVRKLSQADAKRAAR